MDLLSIINQMPANFSEAFMNLSPEERELTYTRGIYATMLENEFNKKGKRADLIFFIQNDPYLFEIKKIKSKKVILKAALNKIFEMTSVEQLREYFDYLGILIEDEYKVESANSFTNQ